MNSIALDLTLFIVALSPPTSDDYQGRFLRRLKDAGVTFQGHVIGDFCMPPLPVNGLGDVGEASVPKSGFDISHLRLMSFFPGLHRVTCHRVLSEKEYRALDAAVASGVQLDCRVRLANGTIVTNGYLSPYSNSDQKDLNGDGIVDEADGDFLPPGSPQPRIRLNP